MFEDALDQDKIRQRGIIWDVPKILGDPEYTVPCSHWANRYGTRLYESKRVAIAEEILATSARGKYVHHLYEMINSSRYPYTPAFAIIDYRKFYSDPNRVVRSAWSHSSLPEGPLSPFSSTIERIIVAAYRIACILYRVEPDSPILTCPHDVEERLRDKSRTASQELGAPFPDVVVREVSLKAGVSTARSDQAARRVLNMLSLVGYGRVLENHYLDDHLLFATLGRKPIFRIDYRIMRPE